jgi:hypothetical protein
MTVRVRKIEGCDEKGDTVNAYIIPNGYCCVLVPQDQAEQLADWQDCRGVRLSPVSDDGRVATLDIEGPA